MMRCDEYDYIEIVCMHRYPIQLSLRSGEIIQGTARDTRINESREECILINIDAEQKLVPLEDIKKLEVLVQNPHFQEMCFN